MQPLPVQPLDYGPQNQRLRELFATYAKARRNLIVGEGLIGEIVLPCVNEIRNGWDDMWQVLNGLVPPDAAGAADFLLDAERHFKRATSEVFEAVLIVRLDELRAILQSLRDDSEFRIVRSRYYSALRSAFDRGRTALANAKDAKHQTPDTATQEAKSGIAIVQGAIEAFMAKVGEFDLAQEVRTILQGQRRDRMTTRNWVIIQVVVAIILFILGIAAAKLWPGKAQVIQINPNRAQTSTQGSSLPISSTRQ